jgi:hypothetical protein
MAVKREQEMIRIRKIRGREEVFDLFRQVTEKIRRERPTAGKQR